MLNLDLNKITIGVIGLGYVGLPLAVELGKKYSTIGYDIKQDRIDKLKQGLDETREVTTEEINSSKHLRLTSSESDLTICNVFIVTVPTPIDKFKRPDLSALIGASETIGRVIRPNSVVIYESTVYPGATEEDCVPVIERVSGLKFNQDFYAGYSPERINPGDKEHRLTNIVKVTSGSTPDATDFVDSLYSSIVTAGTHKASSIRVAEAAKVIENTQRDLNIALVNELAIIFNRLGIDTLEVLEAAGTKWNFLPFRPGLVGGHCIGVDPYYLTHKAQEVGYTPEVILAGRRINDSMGQYIASQVIKRMILKGIQIKGARVLILGLTFKENCPDIRNTKVIDIVEALTTYGITVDVHDPLADANVAFKQHGIRLTNQIQNESYDAIALAVPHIDFEDDNNYNLIKFTKANSVIYDIKSVLSINIISGRL